MAEREDHVYVAISTSGAGPVKVGFSTQPQRREKSLTSPSGESVSMVAKFAVERGLGMMIERMAHAALADACVGGEWFGVSTEKAIAAVEGAIAAAEHIGRATGAPPCQQTDRRHQIIAARALLDWSQDDLAKHARVSKATLATIETDTGNYTRQSLTHVTDALMAAGIEFVNANGRVGVMRRNPT